jgi:hypothetical protein
MGQPLSHGCIRMRNSDLVTLFARVPPHCAVQIDESACPQWADETLLLQVDGE